MTVTGPEFGVRDLQRKLNAARNNLNPKDLNMRLPKALRRRSFPFPDPACIADVMVGCDLPLSTMSTLPADRATGTTDRQRTKKRIKDDDRQS